MKTTFKFIIAAMAAISVFSSCQKELVGETASNTTEGVRVISVTFDNATKASIDEFTPTFADGDEIRVSNSQKSEERTVTVSGTSATFTTTLSGALTVIYPANAAVLTSDATDAPIADFNSFKVPATQDGTMEKAIIAMANVAEGENLATFQGVTSLFEIIPPSGATTVTIKSLKAVVEGARTGEAVAINNGGLDDAAKRIITVSVPTGGKAYASLVSGVKLTDLSFDAGGTYGMKGIPASKITGGLVDATASNKKYTIDNSVNTWHPYVEIEMTVGSDTKTYKWATMNVGATSETDAGLYFMWGYTDGHSVNTTGASISGNDIINAFSGQTFGEGSRGDNTKGFAWDNYIKFTSSTYSSGEQHVFTKYVPTTSTGPNYFAPGFSGDDKTTLDLADDAANANWGGSWRMPTIDEFNAFIGLKQSTSASGFHFGGSDVSEQIFLPFSGDGAVLKLGTFNRGFYWSSSLYAATPTQASILFFLGDSAQKAQKNRFSGYSVRALSE